MSLELFAQAIQKVEGYFAPGQNPLYPSGTLAWKNNNPGNLIYTDYYARNFGAIPGEGKYSRFPNYATGYAALKHQIQVDAGRGLTIGEMMAKYAPSSDGNDPAGYAQTIARALGVSVDTPVLQAISGIAAPAPAMPTEAGLGVYVPILAAAALVALLIAQE